MSRIAGESMVALSMNAATDTANAVTMNTIWLRDNAWVPSLWGVVAVAGSVMRSPLSGDVFARLTPRPIVAPPASGGIQDALVSLQEHDRYHNAIAGRMINAMNALETTTARTAAVKFRRRTMAGAVLVMGITATAVGLAAMSHADDAPAPNTEAANTEATAPVPPWFQTIDPGCRRQLYYFDGRWHCG